MKMTGNTILITGGTAGIGLEMAKQLLEKDNKLIITGRNLEKLEQVKSALTSVSVIQSDVAHPEEVEKLFAAVSSEHPQLNILINNAGVMRKINLQNHDYDLKGLTEELDINLNGPIWMCEKFLPLLKNNKNSAIVNVSSVLAFVPLPISPVYSATKAGLHFYTLSLREQLRNTNIKVFELMPPGTQTDLMGPFKGDLKNNPLMATDKMVSRFMQGLAKDELEIRPGISNQVKFLNRLFPSFLLKQFSKDIE